MKMFRIPETCSENVHPKNFCSKRFFYLILGIKFLIAWTRVGIGSLLISEFQPFKTMTRQKKFRFELVRAESEKDLSPNDAKDDII